MLISKCEKDCLHCAKGVTVLRPLNIDGDRVCIYIGCAAEKRFEIELPKKDWLALSTVTGNDIKAEAWLAARIVETVNLSDGTIERYLRINLREKIENNAE